MIRSTPAVYRSHRAIIESKAASVSTCRASLAPRRSTGRCRRACRRHPPCRRGRVASRGQLLDHRRRQPVGRGGDASCDRLADGDDVGLEPPRSRTATRASRQRVRFVVDQQDTRFTRQRAHTLEVARLGEDDPDFVSAGSINTAATSPCRSSRSNPSRSLNSATRLVNVTSYGAPTLPGRAAARRRP